MPKALAALSIALGFAVVAETVALAGLRRDVRDLHARLDRLETRQRQFVPRADVAEIEEQVRRIETAPPRTEPAPESRSTAARAGEPATTPLTEERISEIIDSKVDEKVKARQGEDNGFGGKKRPLADVAREIGVPKETQAVLAEYADDAKRRVFDLLKLPRSDGSNLVDDIVAALKSDRPQENVGAQFMRIFKENVPGTNETYFAAALRISEETMQRFGTVLTPEQMTGYKHTGVGPLDLETGYDPWVEYMKGK
ncbi:MAG: hypothetical protein HYY17_03095 [Planctomycetes bacterium]|nr:hypothetical protein [Planctomycetota bacterium]